MRSLRALCLLLLCLSLYDCEAQTRIVFTDELMGQYPNDPSSFRAKYGGELKFYRANTETKEKMADIDKAIIEGDGFQVVFWKAKDFYIHHIKLTKNHLKITNIPVIGKTTDEVKQIFGSPTTTSAGGALIYRGKTMVLAFGIDNGTIARCYWGFEI